MTPTMGKLLLPTPIGLQPTWLTSAARRKVLRVGRRGTKTRFAFIAALAGHGPGWDENNPTFGGVLQGGDVVWIAQNYTNLTTVLWREEIVPRMAHLDWIGLNATNHDVNIPGLGSLLLRSGDREAIDSVRGVGKRLKGVIIDEAAWLDLRGALQDVILPACLDNDAWLILMSTTNAGTDGGYDDAGQPQLPSYFNVVCEDIRAGKKSPEWEEFTGTAFDNPELRKESIDELIAEYAPESPKLKQEVFAELLRAGIGLALPDLAAERHIVQRFRVPEHWTQFGAFDWGYNHPWVFGWYAADEDGNVYKIDTLWGRQDLPETIANKILGACPTAKQRGLDFLISAGADIWAQKGRAAGFAGPTIFEQLAEKGLMLVKASAERVLGLDNLRSYLHTPTPRVNDSGRMVMIPPRFRLMDTEGNRRCLAQLQSMQIDPNNIEDALKVDADQAGRGGDDSYDETRYALMSRPLAAPNMREVTADRINDRENRHPGIVSTYKRGELARQPAEPSYGWQFPHVPVAWHVPRRAQDE